MGRSAITKDANTPVGRMNQPVARATFQIRKCNGASVGMKSVHFVGGLGEKELRVLTLEPRRAYDGQFKHRF